MKWIMPIEPKGAKRPRLTPKATLVSMDKVYRDWREEANMWVDDWLKKTNGAILRELLGKGNTSTRDKKNRIRNDYAGIIVNLEFVLPRPSDNIWRAFPIDTHTYDLDNYEKSVIDCYFEHPAFVAAHLNDRYIQQISAIKRYTMDGEETHIGIEMKPIE